MLTQENGIITEDNKQGDKQENKQGSKAAIAKSFADAVAAPRVYDRLQADLIPV
jgi:hypothetical protein